MSGSGSAPSAPLRDARARFRWWLTGFGGCTGRGPFERVTGFAHVSKNGTQLDFFLRFPGEDETRWFSMNQTELRSLLASGSGAFRGHGLSRDLRIETDATSVVAYAEWEATRASQPEAERATEPGSESPGGVR